MSAIAEAVKVMEEAKQEIFRLRDANRELLAALEEVRELIDVVDGNDGLPAANKAMCAVRIIDEAIAKGAA